MAHTPPTYATLATATATAVAALGVSVALGIQAVRPPRTPVKRTTRQMDTETLAELVAQIIQDSDLYAAGYADGLTRRPPATPEEIEAMRPARPASFPRRRYRLRLVEQE